MIETSDSILRNATGLRKCRSGSFTHTFASGLCKKAHGHCDYLGNVRVVVSDKKLSDIVSGLPEDFKWNLELKLSFGLRKATHQLRWRFNSRNQEPPELKQ